MYGIDIEKRTKIEDFEKLRLEVISHKNNAEEENALIQRHVKESRDKCAELMRKFDLTIERIQAKPGQIIGMGLNQTFAGN